MSAIKNLLLPLACRILLTPRSFSEPGSDVKRIFCSENDIKLLTHTSNNVMRISTDDGVLYFRECKLHTDIRDYVAAEIDRYYSDIHPELSEDRRFIENALTDKRRFDRFVNMGIVNDFSSGVYHFCMGHGGHHIGLEGMAPDMEERVKDFAQFIWGDLFTYTLNNGVKKNRYQTYNAVRSIASYRLACILGIDSLIPKTEYAVVCNENGTMFGTVMKEADGVSVDETDVEFRKGVCSPALQHALNNLNILDVVCIEKDHRPGNYNVTVDSGKATGAVAFDNDSPNSFGIGGISFETYLGCSPWVSGNAVNRPYIDKELADRIMNITDADLGNAVGDILNLFQMLTLKLRFRQLKKLLSNAPSDKFIDSDSWSESTVEEELSGKYGVTYLGKFLEEQPKPDQPWIKK